MHVVLDGTWVGQKRNPIEIRAIKASLHQLYMTGINTNILYISTLATR